MQSHRPDTIVERFARSLSPLLLLLGAGLLPAAELADVERLGAGSFLSVPPQGTRIPPTNVFRAPELKGPMPTSDWWSSLAWLRFSETMYAHPLALRAQAEGLRVWHPSQVTANHIGIFGTMPMTAYADLLLGHSKAPQFPDARVGGHSDWFVTAVFATNDASLKVSFGHGSPFVFAQYGGGEPLIKFTARPTVWSGGADAAVLGVTVNQRHYGIFAPAGSRWSGLETPIVTCATGGKGYLSVAALPDNRAETLALFRQHAYAAVTDTKVSWAYEPATATVTTRFEFTTAPWEGAERDTLFALYPHQWLNSDAPLLGPAYPSVRGPLKLAKGRGFVTRMKFPGLVPVLPNVLGAEDLAAARGMLEKLAAEKPPVATDTYWDGKNLGRMATLVMLARETGAEAARAQFRDHLRDRLENWLSADDFSGQPKDRPLFHYEKNWGTLIGSPSSYGSDVELNDHHFHYGYFLQAAAVVTLEQPQWPALRSNMVELLIRDIASPDRNDPLFPFLRCFDPYAGHSWASGAARFADGNNQESSSESLNAWAGLFWWGEVTGNEKWRDLGAWLFTTELAGVENYWFDVTGKLRPPEYKPAVVTLVWGGKSVHETWFSAKPEDKHMINWLPYTGASLYLGRHPAYVRRNYEALRAAVGGDNWLSAADLIQMYRALDDAPDALRQYRERPPRRTDSGNSPANLFYWIASLNRLGQVDAAVTADRPTVAVFNQAGRKTHAFFNPRAQPDTATFSDGTRVEAAPGKFGISLKKP